MNDKDFFKNMVQEVKEYSENIEEAFPYFCLKIFWDDLSDDDIEEALRALTTNDESIDAFFIDDKAREINIIQCKSCKSYNKTTVVKKHDLAYLNKVPETLNNTGYIDRHKNERIKDIATDYLTHKNQGYEEKLHFFHLGQEGTVQLVENNYPKITYYDWDTIKDTYLEYQSKLDRTEPESMKIQLESATISPTIGQKHKTLISVITGDAIVDLREKHRYKLFDKNLRFGLGKTAINKKIQDTTRNEPDNFYFYNNGITITSKDFKENLTNNTLKITYPQIINGAQTVNALYESYQDMVKTKTRKLNGNKKEAIEEIRKHFKRIKIIFRVITDNDKDGKKNTEFENKVIQYNNSQNAVKVTDFYANEREQIDIQRIMAKYGYFYEIKRGDRKHLESNPKEKHNLLQKKKNDFTLWDEKITIENLASIWMAFTEDPSLHAVAKSNIFGYAQDKYYKKIFDKEINDELVKKMIVAYNIMTCIEQQSAIYGKRQKDGQIITKITQFNTENFDEKTYDNIKSMISSVAFLPNQLKKDTMQRDTFLKEKEKILNKIKEYQYFSLGKYLALRIFYFIIDKCEYWNKLINTDLFKDQEYINTYMVKKWIKTILDIIGKEHAEFTQTMGGTLKSFYTRSDTTKNIEKKFKELNYNDEFDKEYKDIFPLG